VTVTVSTLTANSAIFVHAVIREFCPSGVSVPGVMDLGLNHQALSVQLVCVIMLDANIAAVNLCVSCGIVHGVTGRCGNLGRFGLSLKYVDDVAGR